MGGIGDPSLEKLNLSPLQQSGKFWAKDTFHFFFRWTPSTPSRPALPNQVSWSWVTTLLSNTAFSCWTSGELPYYWSRLVAPISSGSSSRCVLDALSTKHFWGEISGFRGSTFLLFVPFLLLLLYLGFGLVLVFFPNPLCQCTPSLPPFHVYWGMNFYLSLAGYGSPPLGLEPTAPLCFSLLAISQSFDCVLQLDHLFLEVVHQDKPLRVQWTTPHTPSYSLTTISFSSATKLSWSCTCKHTSSPWPSGTHEKLRHSLQPETWTETCVLMCEICLGHCVTSDSGFWLSGNHSALLVWWMMAYSLNSVPYLYDLPCKLLFHTFLPCHTLSHSTPGHLHFMELFLSPVDAPEKIPYIPDWLARAPRSSRGSRMLIRSLWAQEFLCTAQCKSHPWTLTQSSLLLLLLPHWYKS